MEEKGKWNKIKGGKRGVLRRWKEVGKREELS